MTRRLALLAAFALPALAFAADDPEAKAGGEKPAADDLPRVLILGDSISIGYTPFVQELLKGEAEVVRPMNGKKPENCAGTTLGVKEIDRWLQIGGGWDVIHFNWGLHDLKRVDPKTGAASNNAGDPRQAEVEVYEKQLREIVAKLKATGATLIYATTTPYPAGTKPRRDPEDAERYNAAAKKIMAENGIAIDDLHGFALPKLKEIQRPVNVHFTPAGSKALAGEVAKHLRAALANPAK
ncbi:MAG: SGNH/GDSL hydrolase family protein [Verrucomicrobiales bacterium]